MGDILHPHHKEVFKSLGRGVNWRWETLFLIILFSLGPQGESLCSNSCLYMMCCVVGGQQLPRSHICCQIALYFIPITKESSLGLPNLAPFSETQMPSIHSPATLKASYLAHRILGDQVSLPWYTLIPPHSLVSLITLCDP